MPVSFARFVGFTTAPDWPSRPVKGVARAAGALVEGAEMIVEGEVFQVVPEFGLAHLCTKTGAVYGLRQATPGIVFDKVQMGQKYRCRVTKRFNRVLQAELLG